jgi:amino acid adenylation domain-containing protein
MQPDQQQMRHLSDRDRRLFVEFGSGPVAPVPHSRIHHAFEYWAAVMPDALAAEHEGEMITYGELDRRADCLAAVLVRHGIGPGDHVGVFVRRSIPMLIGMLAALKAGAAYVPQDIGIAPERQLMHVMYATRMRVVFTQSPYMDRIPETAQRSTLRIAVDTFPDTGPVPHRGLLPAGSPDDGCYVLFTSGTTGTPNGVTVTHRNVCNILLTEPGSLGIRPGMRVAQLLNVAFDMAAWEILGCLSHGGTLLIRGKDISDAAHRAHAIIATPTVLSGIDPAHCPHVEVVAVAGEPCPRPLADLWARRTRFYNSCGPTETTIVNTMQQHEPTAPLLTIGRPTPNNTVYILDEHRKPVPIGETGEMWAGGDCVSAGYLGNPALTAERYAPDPFLGGDRMMFRTRDLGRWTPDGQLEHLGRTDDQVKIRGFRVELDSVSAVLETVPGCARAVTLKRDADSLVSFVCPQDVDTEAARRAVAAALPYYCMPQTVVPLAVLPETSRGKVDKAALLRLAAEAAAAEAGSAWAGSAWAVEAGPAHAAAAGRTVAAGAVSR